MIGVLIRASDWLHRDRFIPDVVSPGGHHDPVASWSTGVARCERHGIAHTGKLARSIILDLAIHDACVAGADHPYAIAPPDENTLRLAPDPIAPPDENTLRSGPIAPPDENTLRFAHD